MYSYAAVPVRFPTVDGGRWDIDDMDRCALGVTLLSDRRSVLNDRIDMGDFG
jgi:hypothetical protein